MPARPKPTKGERAAKKQEQRDELKDYRHVQAALAISRDANLCVICWFRHHRRRNHADVHHVFGRGTKAGDWREEYTSLICVCRSCHPPPIKTPGANDNLAYVEDILRQANEQPINNSFGRLK